MPSPSQRSIALTIGVLLACLSTITTNGQQAPRFGGGYAALDGRRQHLIADWLSRFEKTTGQSLQPAQFYDEVISLSTKTTFEAVTHALMTTQLTDAGGAGLGDALSLVERVETVKGELDEARGDRQFRMYARLKPGALDTLARAQEFKRGEDNAYYHHGYPINYREQGGTPSIQISVALDHLQADIDVDYRSSSIPAALFNGHLTSANSDVRAGDNYDRHLNRWAGFSNWWRSFFGVSEQELPAAPASADKPLLPHQPRAGKQKIEVIVNDFLTAWLIEGNIVPAMGSISDRAYACLAQDTEAPSAFDRGMAPFELMNKLKAAHDALGPHTSLDGLVVGIRLTRPGLRIVRQPHQAQFVLYEVPNDVAAGFDCGSRLTPGDPKNTKRKYGDYFGATFYVAGRKDVPVTLLWGKEDGYWKIMSWESGADDDAAAPAPAVPESPKAARISADQSAVRAARGFLENWLIRKNYDAAFEYLSQKSYACYDLERAKGEAPSASADEAGRKLRAALKAAGDQVGPQKSLAAVIESADPVSPAIRVMNHPDAQVFSLGSIPNALADASECAARSARAAIPDPLPLEYGTAFGTSLRFKTRAGGAPVLKLMWRKEGGTWRITSYDVELP